MKFTTTRFFLLFILVLIIGIGAARHFRETMPATPNELDSLAQCIKDSGATFYGAFWCPHCQDQKSKFGSSAQYLPYHECSTPDGQSQLADCTDIGIKSYPTWILKDGTELDGVQTPEALAKATNCVLPASGT